jgi:hypothetical protein
METHLANVLHRKHPRRFRPTLVQRAKTPDGVAWVFLNGSEVCLAEGVRKSVACTSREQAREDGVFLGTFSPPSPQIPRLHDFQVFGLTPDSVTGVEVKVKTRRHTVAVENNLLSASADHPILIKRLVRGNE